MMNHKELLETHTDEIFWKIFPLILNSGRGKKLTETSSNVQPGIQHDFTNKQKGMVLFGLVCNRENRRGTLRRVQSAFFIWS